MLKAEVQCFTNFLLTILTVCGFCKHKKATYQQKHTQQLAVTFKNFVTNRFASHRIAQRHSRLFRQESDVVPSVDFPSSSSRDDNKL